MKTAFYPVGDIKRASSRYRVHWIVQACPEFIIGNSKNWKSCDVLVFQRTFDGRHRKLAKKAKAAGKLVVFDITDFYSHRHRWKNLWRGAKEMCKIAHCITTGNPDDQHEIRAVFKKRVYVVPTAQKKSGHIRQHKHLPMPAVVWIGRENTMLKTLGKIWPVFVRLTQRGVRFRVLIINDSGNTHGLRLPGNPVVGKKWELSKVYPTIAKCDVGVCPQVKEADGRFHKDENKAVTCWMCGVPCVSFRRTKNWENDLHRLLTNWQLRKKQGRKGVERAKAWLPANVVKKWKGVFRKEMARR